MISSNNLNHEHANEYWDTYEKKQSFNESESNEVGQRPHLVESDHHKHEGETLSPTSLDTELHVSWLVLKLLRQQAQTLYCLTARNSLLILCMTWKSACVIPVFGTDTLRTSGGISIGLRVVNINYNECYHQFIIVETAGGLFRSPSISQQIYMIRSVNIEKKIWGYIAS